MWPCLLEKAWSKLLGSYARVEYGRPNDAAYTLLGSVGRLYNVDSKADTLLPKIVKGCRRDALCFCTSKTSGEIHGVIKNHEYELKDIYELSGLTLLRLRNPWGSVGYKGAWAKSSSSWTDDIKGKVGFDDLKNDPGLFFMEWSEWVTAFRNLSICLEANPKKYTHSGQTLLDFNHNDNKNTFLKFKLDKDYDCTKESFAICLH